MFRAYDTDNSGSISIEEFEAISSNFPFIECFSVLDQDKLGSGRVGGTGLAGEWSIVDLVRSCSVYFTV